MQTTHSDTRDFIVMAGPDGPRLPRLPALEGVRGLAVAAVVLFHAEFGVMVGGYLGVSTFFTLSGFLITSLLINESSRTGGVRLGAFWGRRFRRLLPASLVTLALVSTLFAWFVATADQRATMRGDVLSSLFDVANWHFILSGSAYGDLFVDPSPVLHFWSLAIEEQFYLLFPVLLLGLWKISKGRRSRLGAAFVAGAVLSAALPWIFTMSADRVYFGTDTRAAELLLGSALAVLLSYEGVRRRISLRYRWRVGLLVLAGACAAVQLYWWWTLPQTTEWLYRGGFALYAVMTCTVIAAAAVPFGPLRTALSVAPLNWLGSRSYAIYLVHWPIFLVVRQELAGWGRVPQAVLAIGCSFVLAELSFRVLEQPIRVGRWPSPNRSVRVAVVSVLAVAVIASIPLPVDQAERTVDFDAALEELNSGDATPVPTTAPVPTPAPTPPPVATVASFGDSTALLMGIALRDGADPRLAFVRGDVQIGCGVSRFDRVKVPVASEPDEKCRAWPVAWPAAVAAQHPDIAQLVTGAWEVPDVQLPGSSEWSSIGDPAVDDFVRAELTAAVDALASSGSMVMLVLWPDFAPWAADGRADAIVRQAEPERMQRLREIMREVADSRPTTTRVFDLAEWLGPDRLADRDLRPDGVHIDSEVLKSLFAEGLGDAMYGLWADWWMQERAPALTTAGG